MGPLGLGDADVYISRIAFYKTHFNDAQMLRLSDQYKDQCFTGYGNNEHLIFWGSSYYFLLAKLSNLINVTADKMFYYNFYIGIFLMGAVLLLLLKNIGGNVINIIIGLVVFAFYTGSGGYHGFFWVTPSFYSLLLYLLLVCVLFFSNKYILYTPVLILLLLFCHMSGILLIFSVIGSLIIYGIFNNDIHYELKKAVNVISIFIVYMIIYKILRSYNILLPLLGEGYDRTYSVINFDVNELKRLWEFPEFRKYFFGPFTLLTLAGFYYIIKRKGYKLLSIVAPNIIGLLLLYVIHPRAIRFYYYVEICFILVIIFGINTMMLDIWNRRSEVFNLSGFKIKNGFMVIIYLIMISLSGHFVYDLFLNKVGHDFAFKFYHPRYWEREKMDEFIENKYPNSEIVYLGSADGLCSLLNMSNWWDKKIYTPCVINNKNIQDGLKDYVYIGINYRIYDTHREPNSFKAVLPKDGMLILKAGELTPGEYWLELIDTGLEKGDLKDILFVNDKRYLSKQKYLEGGSKWDSQVAVINYPMKNAYPMIMMPWHSYFASKRGVNEIRKANKYILNLNILNENEDICLLNKGKDKFIHGAIYIYKKSKDIPIAMLDLDWGETYSLKTNAKIFYNGRYHPLLWTDPNISRYGSMFKKMFFELEGNFKDVKVFSLYKDLR